MKKRQWSGVKSAVGDTKRCPNFWIIYADVSTRKVWCDNFTSQNEWNEYHDADVVEVVSGNGPCSIYGLTKITMQDLRELLSEYDGKGE